jgi:tetratricopeptide (TPR) repeat protein
MVQAEWRKMLESAVREGRGDHWLVRLHLGVMYYHNQEIPAAREAWEKSLALAPSAWAYRNLAVLATHQGRKTDAAILLLKAHRMTPGLAPLAIECAQAMIDAGRVKDLVAVLEGLPPAVRVNDRIRILEARAALEAGDLDKVERILLSKMELANIREGEVVLSDLWFEMHEKRLAAKENVPIDEKLRQRVRREFPPPAWIDFRMSTPTTAPATPPEE